MRQQCLLFDVGSSSIRVTLLREGAEEVEGDEDLAFRARERIDADERGWFDVGIIKRACDRLLHQVREWVGEHEVEITSVRIACFATSWLGVDARGDPITPALSYAATDARLSGLTRKLSEHSSAEARLRTGTPLHGSYIPVQMHLLDPDVRDRVVSWTTVSGFLGSVWTGKHPREIPISESDAGWSGMWNWVERMWDTERIDQAGLSAAQLPPVDIDDVDDVDSRANIRTRCLLPCPAARWVPGIPDGVAVTNAVVDDRLDSGSSLSLTVGTSAAVRCFVPRAVARASAAAIAEAGLWCYPVDGDRCLVGGAVTDGAVVDQYRHRLFAPEDGSLDAAAGGSSPPPTGLTVLPFFRGERAPGWREDKSATVAGLRPSTTARDIEQALREGVCFRIRALLQAMWRLPCLSDRRRRIVGSGAVLETGREWAMLMASCLGEPVFVTSGRRRAELTTLGLLAWHRPASREQIPRDPVEGSHLEQYHEAFRRHEALYSALNGVQ